MPTMHHHHNQDTPQHSDCHRNHHPLMNIVNLHLYPLHHPMDSQERQLIQNASRKQLEKTSVVTLPDFLPPNTVEILAHEAMEQMHQAFYTHEDHTHNVYLTPKDPSLPEHHVYNRQVVSTKGCIQTDQIPLKSMLLTLYHDKSFQEFLQEILGVERLYPYKDPLSSINIHFASEGQELGWHFDNSAFAITLLLQEPEGGGIFEYVPNVRNSSLGHDSNTTTTAAAASSMVNVEATMGYSMVEKILNGEILPNKLQIKPGTLVLFRGRDSLHRVTQVTGYRTRVLVVLAYNEKPGVELSEEARMTFFGRTGMEGGR